MPEASESFESHRRHLWALAYRMLGSAAEAEDIVQEAYLRARDVAPETMHSTRAYLSAIVTRLCLDHWKSAKVRRETYVGPWLPEPIATDTREPVDPSSISLAFMVLLESSSARRTCCARCSTTATPRSHRSSTGTRAYAPSVEIAQVNGLPALVLRVREAVFSIIDIESDGARILSLRSIANPDKLSGFDAT